MFCLDYLLQSINNDIWTKIVLQLFVDKGINILNVKCIGSGASGRVYKIDENICYKIVFDLFDINNSNINNNNNNQNCMKLKSEYYYITKAAKKCPNNLIGTFDEFSNHIILNINVAYYIMNKIGESYNNNDNNNNNITNQNIIEILQSLSDLHSNDIQHGDARLQNVIKYNNLYLWIDLIPDFCTEETIKKDIIMFLNSINKIPNVNKIEEYAMNCYSNYWSKNERYNFIEILFDFI